MLFKIFKKSILQIKTIQIKKQTVNLHYDTQ